MEDDDMNPDMYLNKLLKECSLTELMDREHEMYKQIQALDSEMQTLVYENYNKFISATDTIRKMKKDLKKMEEEMEGLASNMASISDFSGQISGTLQGRREHMVRLSGTHALLKKLQLLFELPPRLSACMDCKAYSQAVRYYTRAQAILHQYQDMPSFHGIHHDCNLIVAQLKDRLKEQLHSTAVTPQELAHLVQLLFDLQEPTEALCSEYLLNAGRPLEAHLELLEQLQEDILQFMDVACNRFGWGLRNVATSYLHLFLEELPITESSLVNAKLQLFVDSLMQRYLAIVERRLATETCDNELLVKGLDRFCQRLEGAYVAAAVRIAREAARGRCSRALDALEQFFGQHLMDVRQQIRKDNLAHLHSGLSSAVMRQLGQVLASLQAFVQAAFAQEHSFKEPFCLDVRERVVVGLIRHISSTALEFCAQPCGLLLLFLSRLSMDMKTTMVNEMLEIVDEHFPVCGKVTPTTALLEECGHVAQSLLDEFVRAQGLVISQMLRKSVDTRDWLHTLEPRTVRAVMKRVVEDVTAVDVAVGQLYQEGNRKQRSSDSSRRTYPYSASGRAARGGRWAGVDHSLLSNIQKLFLEKMDIFSTVDFSRVSVMSGIIKIGLKTYLECIRLKTFSRFALQQVQVDTHYLQLYLWRFVSDENLVHVLLDEIMGSAIHRCLDPVLMEPSVVEVICERG